MYVIPENQVFEHNNQVFFNIFRKLSIAQMLRAANITKNHGISAYKLFKTLFLLVFYQKNLYGLLHSKRKQDCASKNSYYRFMNDNTFNWRKFLLLLSGKVCHYFITLTNPKRKKVFIIDDTIIARNRSKAVELLATVYDHANACYRKGFTLLTLGFSDGYSFLPVDFALLSSAKKSNRHQESDPTIDKRTNGYKRRKEALMTKPELALKLIKHALKQGIVADYVLMDTWFSNEPLISAITALGLDVVAMVKKGRQLYQVDGEMMHIARIYKRLAKTRGRQIISAVNVKTKQGIPVKLVFVKNRSRVKDYLVLISTDLTLSEKEIVRIYGNRWAIESFFKTAKQNLKLGREFQSRNFDALICSISLVFTRYTVLEYIRRLNCDYKTLDSLFACYCDEVRDVDYDYAVTSLLDLLIKLCHEHGEAFTKSLKKQLDYWMSMQASFIKLLMPDFCWES